MQDADISEVWALEEAYWRCIQQGDVESYPRPVA